MWAAQKKILPFAQIAGAKNVQYANHLTVLSFCDYIISRTMHQKRPKLKGRFVLIIIIFFLPEAYSK
jgi:hypothetical protein